jgi:hypothetical protein
LLKRVPNGHAARDRVSLRAKQKRDMEQKAAKQAKDTNKGMTGEINPTEISNLYKIQQIAL